MLVSSDPRLGFRYAGDPDGYKVDGDAPVGWDAELYRNGSFLAFQRIPENGRYLFENVELINGYNLFQIVLYGPEGQKSTITREVLRGAYMLKKDEFEYDAALGLPNSDFLPFAETAREDKAPGMSAQAFYGINDFLTIGANVFSSSESEEEKRDTGTTLTASSAFLGMNLQGHVLMANQNRQAYEVSVNTRPRGYNVSLLHRAYKGFDVDTQDEESSTELSFYKNFKFFNLNLIASKTSYLDKEDEVSLEKIISADFFNIKFTNDLTKIISRNPSQEDFGGELTALADLWDIRLRSSLLYNLDNKTPDTFKSFSFSGQRDIDSRSSIRAGASRDFLTGVDLFDIQYSRDLEKVGLDIGMSASTDENYTFTVGLRAALQPDENNSYHFTDPKSGGLAAIGARSFMDRNGNGVYDPETDEVIKGTKFRSSYNGAKENTDNEGVAWIRELGEAPTRISILEDSIPDIYMIPNFAFKDLIPRKGINPIIDFPFSQMGEVEGMITYNGTGVADAPVQLVRIGEEGKFQAIDTTTTEYDGYYIFSGVPNGSYKVVASATGFENDAADRKEASSKENNFNPTQSPVMTIDMKVTSGFMAQLKDYLANKFKFKSLKRGGAGQQVYIEDMPLEGNIKDIKAQDVQQILEQKEKSGKKK